jgi:hypothetical protein
MRTRLLLPLILSFIAVGCSSVPKRNWEAHALAAHAAQPDAAEYPRLVKCYSRGLLDGYIARFSTLDDGRGVEYSFDRHGELEKVVHWRR